MTAPTPAVVPPRPPRLFAFTFGTSVAERRGTALRAAHRDVERLHKALAAILADPTEANLDLTVEAYRRARSRAADALWLLDALLVDTPVPDPKRAGS